RVRCGRRKATTRVDVGRAGEGFGPGDNAWRGKRGVGLLSAGYVHLTNTNHIYDDQWTFDNGVLANAAF
ncbi:unnamed protein product, partial [Pylaiella littoralis]